MLLQQLVLLLSHSSSHTALYLSVMRPRAHSLAAALCLCLCLPALPAFWQLLCEVRASRAFSFVFNFGALGSNCSSSKLAAQAREPHTKSKQKQTLVHKV